MSDDSVAPPESDPLEPAPPYPARRSRAGALLFGLALAGLLLGGAWFALRLKPRVDPPAEAVARPADTVQVIRPPSARPTAAITAADLPGFDAEELTPHQLRWLYHKARLERCSCGCGWNVAECRINDPNCPKSPGRAKELVAEAKLQKP